MALQSIGYPSAQTSSLGLPGYNLPKSTDSSRNLLPQSGTRQSSLSAKISSESYSSEKYAIEFTSKDGDKVSFSYEAVKYSSTSMELSAEGSKEDIRDLEQYVRNQLKEMTQKIVKDFLKDAGIKVDESEGTEGNDVVNEAVQIPEEWNAENTSQRIVDFALSFYDSFKGKGEEFLSKIKSAIDEGFKQAKELLGDFEMPDSVSNLVKDTHDLIMSKLDAWAKEKGIQVDDGSKTVIAQKDPEEATVVDMAA
jgi:cation transport regulator ChaB